MICIGLGPGPKNVLVEDEHGKHVVVPYAIWKHKLSKETRLSEGRKVYRGVTGYVQKFPDQPLIREVPTKSSGTVRHITVRAIGSNDPETGGQVLVDVGLFDQWEHVVIEEDDLIAVEGPDSTNHKNGKSYPGVQAYRLNVNGVKQVAQRHETVNTGSSTPAGSW